MITRLVLFAVPALLAGFIGILDAAQSSTPVTITLVRWPFT
jgi:hypothetical protein